MKPLEGPVGHPDPRSVKPLALAQVIREGLITSNIKVRATLRQAPKYDGYERGFDDDPLAPARGIMNGLRLSVVIWGLLALVVVLIR